MSKLSTLNESYKIPRIRIIVIIEDRNCVFKILILITFTTYFIKTIALNGLNSMKTTKYSVVNLYKPTSTMLKLLLNVKTS